MAEASINSVQTMALPLAGFPCAININVFAGMVQNRPNLLVDARELHFSLELEHEFAPWIAGRMAVYGYVGGQDYVPVLRGGIPAAEHQRAFSYFLSLDMAKELAIIEPGDRSKAVKHYLQRFDQRHQAAQTLAAILSPGMSWNLHSGGKVSGAWDSERGGFLEFRGERSVAASSQTGGAERRGDQNGDASQFHESAKPESQPLRHANLQFGGTHFEIVDRNGQVWLRGQQIGNALGYHDGQKKIFDLYNRNADEFTDSMTALVKLPDLHPRNGDAGQMREVRIFSLRGCHLLGMLARTEKAKEFRRWVLDVLDKEVASQKPSPVPAPANFLPGLNVGEEDTLLKHLVENLLRGKMMFWDTANGVMKLKEILESDQGGQTLGIRSFEAALRDAVGDPYSSGAPWAENFSSHRGYGQGLGRHRGQHQGKDGEALSPAVRPARPDARCAGDVGLPPRWREGGTGVGQQERAARGFAHRGAGRGRIFTGKRGTGGTSA